MAIISISPQETNLFKIVQVLIQLIQGRSNSVGRVTLTPNQTTTVVTKATDPAAENVAVGSEIFLSPRTANAAAAMTNVYVSAVGQRTFTLTHSNTATTDRIYGWEARG